MPIGDAGSDQHDPPQSDATKLENIREEKREAIDNHAEAEATRNTEMRFEALRSSAVHAKRATTPVTEHEALNTLKRIEKESYTRVMGEAEKTLRKVVERGKFNKPTREELLQRFKHIKPTEDQGRRMGEMRLAIADLAIFCVERTPVSSEQTRALNALDEAMFLFNAAIARTEQIDLVAKPPEAKSYAIFFEKFDTGKWVLHLPPKDVAEAYQRAKDTILNWLGVFSPVYLPERSVGMDDHYITSLSDFQAENLYRELTQGGFNVQRVQRERITVEFSVEEAQGIARESLMRIGMSVVQGEKKLQRGADILRQADKLFELGAFPVAAWQSIFTSSAILRGQNITVLWAEPFRASPSIQQQIGAMLAAMGYIEEIVPWGESKD